MTRKQDAIFEAGCSIDDQRQAVLPNPIRSILFPGKGMFAMKKFLSFLPVLGLAAFLGCPAEAPVKPAADAVHDAADAATDAADAATDAADAATDAADAATDAADAATDAATDATDAATDAADDATDGTDKPEGN